LRFVLIGWVVLYHLDSPCGSRACWLRPVLGVGYLGVTGSSSCLGFALWLG
jgi:hypothetical protein